MGARARAAIMKAASSIGEEPRRADLAFCVARARARSARGGEIDAYPMGRPILFVYLLGDLVILSARRAWLIPVVAQ